MTFSRVRAGLRSSDRRLWLAVLAVVIAVAAAITAIITVGAPPHGGQVGAPPHGGPVHAIQTPARIGPFVRTPDMDVYQAIRDPTMPSIKPTTRPVTSFPWRWQA